MSSPFDYVKSFSSKEDFWEEDNGKSYEPWVINKGISFMRDCVHAANMMNTYYELDKKAQHDFLFNFISKGKRYGSWMKKEESADVQIVADYFCINKPMAEKYIALLSGEQLQIIKNKMNKGGRYGR